MHIGPVREEISQLLVLQDRDMHVVDLEAQLKHIPLEIEGLNKRIAEIQAELDQQAQTLKDLEVDRSRLEKEVKGFEDLMVKYKNQQLLVKKNEEYQALNQQMDDLKKSMAEHEDTILERMMEIDETRAKNDESAESLKKRIGLFEKEIATLKERQTNLNEQLKGAKDEASKAEATVNKDDLAHYKRVQAQKIRYPLVVSLEVDRCKGCHIRVSQEIVSAAKNPNSTGFCDSCGRIVYA